MRTVMVDGKSVTPSKVVCVGRNYVEHIKELNNEVDKKIEKATTGLVPKL